VKVTRCQLRTTGIPAIGELHKATESTVKIVKLEREEGMPTKRETIAPHGEKRFIRRDANGRFTSDQVDAGRSIAQDRRQKAKTVVQSGMGDRGDQKRS